MKIEAKLLYSPDGNLGNAYRQGVMTSSAKWVLMLDHDVIILHPNWHKVCEEAIDKNPLAGLFTCYASMIGSKTQQAAGTPENTLPVSCHRQFAKTLFSANGFGVTNITKPSHKVSGFFMLIKKEAFMIAGVSDGFFGVDWDLKDRIVDCGYKVYRMNGVYCYHLRDREESWINGERVSRDFDK